MSVLVQHQRSLNALTVYDAAGENSKMRECLARERPVSCKPQTYGAARGLQMYGLIWIYWRPYWIARDCAGLGWAGFK